MTYPPFAIFCLPRSRSRWLSEFLSVKPWIVHHDFSIDAINLAHFHSEVMHNNIGYIETGAAPYWRLLKSWRPSIRLAVIRRPIEECARSLVHQGITPDIPHLYAINGFLKEISKEPGTLSISFSDLSNKEKCRELFRHCVCQEMPDSRFDEYVGRNIQIYMPSRLARMTEGAKRIARLKAEATEALQCLN